MSRIGDPTFEYHTVLTQIWGLTALRLANSDILPFDFAANAAALRVFLSELESRNKITPQQVPLKRLYERIAGFEMAGKQLHEVTMHDLASGNVNPEKIQHLNEQLLQVESNWLDPAGIPGRPWFPFSIQPGTHMLIWNSPALRKQSKARIGNWPPNRSICWTPPW